MSSENISETFSFVPDVQSSELLLHEHELETTTSFVMYYNYGVGKGRFTSNELWVMAKKKKNGMLYMLGLGYRERNAEKVTSK